MICRPFDHGAAIVVHSTTKYIGGHGTSIGGIIVDGGNFDWAAHAKRFPTLNEPDPSYHGAVWTEAVRPLGPIAYIIRARVVLLRDIGSAMSPFNAFQFIQGLETLPLRMREHCRNAGEVAIHLQRHPASRPRSLSRGCTTTPSSSRRAKTYLTGGFGGLVGFELKRGREAGARFIDALKLFYHVANIGDARSLAIHPASTTHSQLERRRSAGQRRDARLRAPFGRHRAHRRHRCRSRPSIADRNVAADSQGGLNRIAACNRHAAFSRQHQEGLSPCLSSFLKDVPPQRCCGRRALRSFIGRRRAARHFASGSLT